MTRPSTVLVDLRVAQINGDRGIPAYSQSLTLELARGYPQHHWLLLHDPVHPQPARASELAEHARWCTVADLAKPQIPSVDVLLTACYFFVPHKGRTADAIIPPVIQQQRPRRMGIVYDLIPLLFPDRYLKNTNARKRYFECLDVMRGSDHLFAISHATRRDTIRHAAIDPRRVHCIYGDIDHAKRALMALPDSATAQVPARHGLRGRYCAYVGGDDWRKNLGGAVRAFAQFWRRNPTYQLAIVCKLPDDRIASLQAAAASAGLPLGAVVFTGFVTDEELVGLVRHAEMVVFPSLYEGLGLPVLEAYGCGTPVVGSNTSSVAELVLPELSCDPGSPSSIAAAMERLIADPSLREASLALGRKLAAEELGWSRAAEQVMECVKGRPRASTARLSPARHPGAPNRTSRLAVVTTVLPTAATMRLVDVQWQTSYFEVGVGPTVQSRHEDASVTRVLPVEVLPAGLLRGRYDAVVFAVGDTPSDAKVLEAVMRSRGTVARRILWLRHAAVDPVFSAWLKSKRGAPTAVGAGLRLLVEQGEVDALIVDSHASRAQTFEALGSLADSVEIAVSDEPLDSTLLQPVTARDTTATYSHGAA